MKNALISQINMDFKTRNSLLFKTLSTADSFSVCAPLRQFSHTLSCSFHFHFHGSLKFHFHCFSFDSLLMKENITLDYKSIYEMNLTIKNEMRVQKINPFHASSQ